MNAALQRTEDVQQLGLYQGTGAGIPGNQRPVPCPAAPLCARCRAREARYGFCDDTGRDGGARSLERPRTLCFGCFRIELTRRQRVSAHLARGWNAEQAELPLSEILEDVTRRRRRAQIAARHAMGI